MEQIDIELPYLYGCRWTAELRHIQTGDRITCNPDRCTIPSYKPLDRQEIYDCILAYLRVWPQYEVLSIDISEAWSIDS